MTLIDSIVLGVVEGVTEFLPVSSTAHLVLASSLLKIEQDNFLNAFNIIIQIAPIFSVLLIYFERLFQTWTLWFKLILAFIPTGIVGLLLHDQIESLFNPVFAVILMIATGIAFIAIEQFYKEKEHHVDDLDAVTYTQAMWVGVSQVFALVPGISRSGSTILGGMLAGLKRDVAMGFSFLLAIPTMAAASGYTLYKEYTALNGSDTLLLGVGFTVSFVVGYLAIKGFLAIVSRYSFVPFGWYLIATGLVFGIFGIEA